MNNTVNILLVDDKPANLTVLESILDEPDYRLTKAQSAQQALMALFEADFALIILDVRMPETSGLELAKLIKERRRTQDVPIIFVTAHYSEDEHVLSGYSAGAVDYLTKPINPAILKSKVAVFADLYRKTHALNEVNQVLNRRNQELLAANKELEAFSYTISHDLRAPLRHINGFVDSLREQAGLHLDEEGRHFLAKIENSAREMSNLIDHLLAFSRMGRAEIHPALVDMNELLQRALDDLEPEIKGRHIEWHLTPLPKVEADAPLMHQVWTNLLSNAVKYTRPRDPARIEVGCSESSHPELVFFIRDNGVGFDMKYADKLFGVFSRLHRSHEFEGTGIGLANVRRIISRHGGQIWAVGQPGLGATVSFTLRKPAAAKPQIDRTEPMAEMHSPFDC
jgi:two-component system sensor histidine kinase/response regulator